MAGAANPARVFGGPQSTANFRQPVAFQPRPVDRPLQGRASVQQPAAQMGGGMANPYQQAAGAQQAALAGTASAMGYRPQQVQGTSYQATGYGPASYEATGYTASTMQGPNTAASQMANYQNPYENQVVQATLRDIGGQAEQGFNKLDAQATQAGAFGGSRHGIAQAEMAKGYTQQMADAAARLRAQGFNTALGAGQFDVGQQQAAAQANMAAQNAASQFGASAANQAGQFGAAAANQAGQFGASAANTAASQAAQNAMTAQQLNQAAGLQGAQFGLGAAQQLAGLGGQSFGYGQSIQNQQMQQGMMQQQQMQALIDAAKAQYGGYTQAPLNKLNLPLAALGQAPVPETRTENRQLGLFDDLTAGAKLYAGM